MKRYINDYDKELKFIPFTHFTTFYNFVKWVGTQQTRDIDPKPIQCRPTVYDTGPTQKQHRAAVPVRVCRVITQRARDIDPMHVQC